jgi:hypothetical protein
MEPPEKPGLRWLEEIRGDHAQTLIESDERVIKVPGGPGRALTGAKRQAKLFGERARLLHRTDGHTAVGCRNSPQLLVPVDATPILKVTPCA